MNYRTLDRTSPSEPRTSYATAESILDVLLDPFCTIRQGPSKLYVHTIHPKDQRYLQFTLCTLTGHGEGPYGQGETTTKCSVRTAELVPGHVFRTRVCTTGTTPCIRKHLVKVTH